MERDAVEHHEIFLSGLRVKVRSSCARTNRHLRCHWSAATTPIVETESACEIEVIADDSPRIKVDGEVVWSDEQRDYLAAGFEQWLYRLGFARHKARFVVFHAAALVTEGATFVFSGPSGAGKSSLALAAVRRGWRYFSDEFVVTDGQRLWGWPRAIRFDAPEPGGLRPSYLQGLDCDEDAVHSTERAAPPYYPVAPEVLQRSPRPAGEVRLVSIERGAQTALTEVSATIALQRWTEASFFEPSVSLGALVGTSKAWSASWRHPDELLDLIEAT